MLYIYLLYNLHNIAKISAIVYVPLVICSYGKWKADDNRSSAHAGKQSHDE